MLILQGVEDFLRNSHTNEKLILMSHMPVLSEESPWDLLVTVQNTTGMDVL